MDTTISEIYDQITIGHVAIFAGAVVAFSLVCFLLSKSAFWRRER